MLFNLISKHIIINYYINFVYNFWANDKNIYLKMPHTFNITLTFLIKFSYEIYTLFVVIF
jgi:hypothetical protein